MKKTTLLLVSIALGFLGRTDADPSLDAATSVFPPGYGPPPGSPSAYGPPDFSFEKYFREAEERTSEQDLADLVEDDSLDLLRIGDRLDAALETYAQ
ncbi:unnamed protein product [Cyprideis torosa]|uniref:Uncharacterized protein n=1 Tax=Cyprideis torosa TaxID=163714 RepID=A0A7R8WCC9_9CRUS|nr:unnamed protein product [Cyprideis torosa]CAG0888306.1 unnamed protein product [Cyprideis torosa]